MLKVLERHVNAQVKTLSAEYSSKSGDFVVTETPQNSLTKFLADPAKDMHKSINRMQTGTFSDMSQASFEMTSAFQEAPETISKTPSRLSVTNFKNRFALKNAELKMK